MKAATSRSRRLRARRPFERRESRPTDRLESFRFGHKRGAFAIGDELAVDAFRTANTNTVTSLTAGAALVSELAIAAATNASYAKR